MWSQWWPVYTGLTVDDMKMLKEMLNIIVTLRSFNIKKNLVLLVLSQQLTEKKRILPHKLKVTI
jgi:hypothetical protein